MTRLLVDVGRRDGVSAAHIVAAIANEGDVPGKAIGAIDIYDRFTFVDVPSEFTEQVLTQMRNSRIRSQKANVRVADSSDAAGKTPTGFKDKRAAFAGKSGGEKPPRRKKSAMPPKFEKSRKKPKRIKKGR